MMLREIQILIIMLHFIEMVNTTCITSKYCYKPLDHIMCAHFNGENKCELIDNNIFSSYNPCEFKKHCVDGYCQVNNSNMASIEGYGECVCFCGNLAFGKQCERTENSGLKFPGAVQFITPSHVVFNKPATFIISVGQFPEESVHQVGQLDFLVHDLFGGYVARVPSRPTQVKVESIEHAVEYCTKLALKKTYLELEVCSFLKTNRPAFLYSFEFVIPFELYSTTPMGVYATSFIRQLQLDVYWKNIKLSEHVHSYHLDLPDYFWLYHFVRFQGCGQNMARLQMYKYNDNIELYANLVPFKLPDVTSGYEIGFEKFALLKWEVYRLDLAGENTNNFPIIYRFNDLSLEIPPFKLHGTYYVNFTYKGLASFKSAVGSEADQVHRWVTSFDTCIFGVSYSGLLAKIKGGTSRSVYRQHKVIMDLSDSRNPNDPDGMSTIILTIFCNWSAEAVCKPQTVDSKTHWLYYIEPMVLKSNHVYRFTLQVSPDRYNDYLKPAFTTQLIYVDELEKNQTLKDISIICVYNCGEKSNPADIVYFRVGCSWGLLNELSFEWEAWELSEGAMSKAIPVDSLRQNDTPSFILILNEGVLTENTTYTFKVTHKFSPAFAVHPILTSSLGNFSCRIDPNNGVAGVTVFTLACTESNSTTAFEIYDKYQSDASGFSGRMIASQTSGSIKSLILTRGNLEINNIDEYGMVSVTTITVQLSKGNLTNDEIYAYIESLIGQMSELNVEESLKRVSEISDMLVFQQINNTSIFDTLIQYLSRLKISRYTDAKVGISTLHNALMSVKGSLSLEATCYTARLLHKLVKALSDGLKNNEHCTFQVLHQISRHILDCFHVVLDAKEKFIRNDVLPQKYVEPVVYSRLKEVSKFLISSSFLLQTGLSYRQMPAQKESLIESKVGNTSLWIKVDIPLALSKYTLDQNRQNFIPVFISDELAANIQKKSHYVALQYVDFRKNPSYGTGPNTENIFDVRLCFKTDANKHCIHPKFFRHPVNVVFSVSELIKKKVAFKNISVAFKQFDYNSTDPDIKLTAYKIHPSPLSLVEAHFEFKVNDTELLVMAKRDVRPTFELLKTEGQTVSSRSAVVQVVTKPSSDQHLYYLAITPRSQGHQNLTVHFSMKMVSKSCYSWHNKWQTVGCQPKADSNSGALICQCNRPSLIGGLVKEVEFSLENVEYFPFFLTLSDTNYNVVLVLCLPLLVLLFILFVFVCRKADHNGRRKRCVSVPNRDKYGYLVCVVTSARLGLGTGAAVGIKIYGKVNKSQSHILSSDTCEVKEGLEAFWFAIYELEHLGHIESLDIWRDNSGDIITSIIIYDLMEQNYYFFLVNGLINKEFSV